MKFDRNTKYFFHDKAFESVVCEIAAILSRKKWVNTIYNPVAVSYVWYTNHQHAGSNLYSSYKRKPQYTTMFNTNSPVKSVYLLYLGFRISIYIYIYFENCYIALFDIYIQCNEKCYFDVDLYFVVSSIVKQTSVIVLGPSDSCSVIRIGRLLVTLRHFRPPPPPPPPPPPLKSALWNRTTNSPPPPPPPVEECALK